MDIDGLAEQVLKKIDDRTEIISMLVGICSTFRGRPDAKADEFVDELIDSVKKASDSTPVPSEGDWASFKQDFIRICRSMVL